MTKRDDIMDEHVARLWFELFRTPRVGPKTLVKIAKSLNLEEPFCETQQATEELINKLESQLQRARAKAKAHSKMTPEDEEKISKEYEAIRGAGIEIIYPGHPAYLSELFARVDIFSVSPVLFVKGKNKSLLKVANNIAIVGSRDASEEELEMTRRIAFDLAQAGKNIVSGYAAGVDSAAHLGALEAEGTTTMVLSYGILEFKKKKVFNKFLRWDQDVLVVSQFAPSEKWSTPYAMIRNKLVCALSCAVVVIKSGPERRDGKMSGTFDAAKTALKRGIPLFVMDPAWFASPPEGNLALIKQGGRPIRGAADILEYLERDGEQWRGMAVSRPGQGSGDAVQLGLFGQGDSDQ